MPWAWRQWPGPPGPLAIDGLSDREGYLDLVTQPHIPTFRARATLPFLLSLLMPLPILVGGLPAVLLVPIPAVWVLLPWMMRREWLATQAFFACDHIVLRRATGKIAQQAISLETLSRIDATQNPLQARTGSCTLRFLRVLEDDSGDVEELAVVRDVEWNLAQHVLANYQAALSAPQQSEAQAAEAIGSPATSEENGASNWSASNPPSLP